MIYLDYSATTPVNKEVLDTFVKVSTDFIGNPNSLHKLGLESKKIIDASTNQIKKILNVDHEVIYTSGASESNNTVIKGIAMRYQNRGKHIITTKFEHSSIIAPLNYLQKQGFKVDFVNTLPNGLVDLDDLKRLITDDTILVTIGAVASEIGIRQPIEEIALLMKDYPNTFFHVDATQAIGKVSINLKDVDLVSFAAHKFYGLKGIGILLKKPNIDFEPLIHGGKSTTKYRSGTPAVALIASVAKALRLIKRDTATLSALTKIDYKGTPRKSVKSIFNLLDSFSINDVIKAINSLDLEDKDAIYERFGKTLNKINEVPYNTLAKIYNEILPKLEKSMGFKTVVEDTLILPSNFKSLPELFPNYSEEQIREGIASLNQKQQQVLKNRYGESLVENRPITIKDKSNISSNILPRLKAYLKQNFNQNKEYNFQIPEEIKLDMRTKIKLLEILNADYFKPIVETYGISSAIAIAIAYGHISSQFYDFQTIASLLNTTPEHVKAIFNNYLNNIDKINMEGKSLQKKRRE